MRADFRLDALELIHELLIYMQAACGIDDDIVVALVPCKRDRLFGCFNRILRTLFKDRYADLFTEHLKLFDSRRAIDIARDEHRSAAAVLSMSASLRSASFYLRPEDRRALSLSADAPQSQGGSSCRP